MLIDSAEEFFKICDKSDVRSLYEASRQYAKFHQNYTDGDGVFIDKTSQTMMEKILAQTHSTPQDQVADMRKKREEAIKHFCYIYGGYIAWKLNRDWIKSGFFDIVEKNEFLSLATEQVVRALIRKLQKDGYQEGKFSHLVHRSIKNKSRDVADKYSTWKKHHNYISFDNAEDIIGGEIDIIDDNGTGREADFDIDEKELESAGILQILKKVKTKNSADDYNMFILHRVEKQELKDIARLFDLSISTVSRRINDFTDAAIKLYRQYQEDMEKY